MSKFEKIVLKKCREAEGQWVRFGGMGNILNRLESLGLIEVDWGGIPGVTRMTTPARLKVI